MHRIFTKPLGYAGDYEMIDMIVRNECEGSSLFSKLLQVFILDQAPARSVRNRVDYFLQRFIEETSRVARLGRPASIFSLGCGPAREIQRFIHEQSLSERARFRLLDFNEETLRYAGARLDEVKRRSHRNTPINLVRKSVHNLLRAGARPAPEEGQFDFIYCSGLYDYLNDRICKTLNSYLYEQLAPGGLLVVTNFDPCNPIRCIQEHIFDWFLIYRNGRELARVAPDQAIADNCAVRAEYTGCNIFLEIRKPG
jgi:extracellular factor (EF) 3-hydroxypalmitic acid methyl ester biosynthesis protein